MSPSSSISPAGHSREKTADDAEMASLLGSILSKILSNEDLQHSFRQVLQTVLSEWAGQNPFKRLSAFLAANAIPTLPPAEDKDQLRSEMAAEIGRLLMYHWQRRAHEFRENPQQAGVQAAAFITEFLENTDFSEWKAMIENSRESRLHLFRTINELIPEYHGKLLVGMATLPALISIAANGLKIFLETQLKVMPPDMLFEINSGINEQIDWTEISRVINDYNDLKTRVHVGSSLAGDGVTPALQSLAAAILSGIAGDLDLEKMTEARIAGAERREAIENAMSDVMTRFPEFAEKKLSGRAAVFNARLRAARNRLKTISDLPEENFNRFLKEVENSFDALELADLITISTDLIVRVMETRPHLVAETTGKIAATIDPDSLEEAGSALIPDFFRAIKPALTPLMPSLIHGLCDLATPEDGEEDGETTEALTRLGRLLGGQNVDQ